MKEWQYMKDSLDAAEKLGSNLFVGSAGIRRLAAFGSRKAEQRKKEEKLTYCVLSFGKWLNMHPKKMITICLEALNRFETSFLNLTSTGYRYYSSGRSSQL